MKRSIEITKEMDDKIQFMLRVHDSSDDPITISEKDLIETALFLYQLSCMSSYMELPGLVLWDMARKVQGSDV